MFVYGKRKKIKYIDIFNTNNLSRNKLKKNQLRFTLTPDKIHVYIYTSTNRVSSPTDIIFSQKKKKKDETNIEKDSTFYREKKKI